MKEYPKQYNVAIEYSGHGGAYSGENTLEMAEQNLINHVIYYSAIGRIIETATITECCATCQGYGEVKQSLKRRSKGKFYKMVTCPDCKGLGLPITIKSYIDNILPNWVLDAFKK